MYYVPSIHAATRASIDIDPHRLSGGVKRAAARGRDRAAGTVTRHRRGWLRKDAHAHLSRSLLARERNRSAKYLAAYFHEQSRAADARSRCEFAAGRRKRPLGWDVSLGGKQDPAPARERARLFERIHDHGPRRPKGFDQRRRSK